MAEPGTGDASAGADHHPNIDWRAAEASAEFRELKKKRRGWVLPATIFFLAWYFGFVILAGYAKDFMGREFLTDGLTVGYVFAFSQFIMVWVLAVVYVRRADKVFDPLSKKAAEKAIEASRGGSPPAAGSPAATEPGRAGRR
ncbi:MAG: DUF485 domain-containing protein [Actinomycetota bacterium]|nr:DUF485 domain-containing protein [Actinomycetota bacterium]